MNTWNEEIIFDSVIQFNDEVRLDGLLDSGLDKLLGILSAGNLVESDQSQKAENNKSAT